MGTPKPVYTYAATVEKVVDGDTVDVDLDLGMRIHFKTRLRLEGIDAPEMSTGDGKTVKALLQELLPVGASVTVQTRKPDKYGRALATVTSNAGVDVATWLLENAPGVKKYTD